LNLTNMWTKNWWWGSPNFYCGKEKCEGLEIGWNCWYRNIWWIERLNWREGEVGVYMYEVLRNMKEREKESGCFLFKF